MIAVIAGGAPFRFASWGELAAAGDGATYVNLPGRYLAAMPTMPADGTLLRATGDPAVWLVTGGRRSQVTPQPGRHGGGPRPRPGRHPHRLAIQAARRTGG